MPKPAAGLPAGANVNHMRNERGPGNQSFLVQYSIAGHVPTEDSKIAVIAECLLQTASSLFFPPRTLHCNHSQASFHPARIAKVGAPSTPATQDATRPATPHANSESLGKASAPHPRTLV